MRVYRVRCETESPHEVNIDTTPAQRIVGRIGHDVDILAVTGQDAIKHARAAFYRGGFNFTAKPAPLACQTKEYKGRLFLLGDFITNAAADMMNDAQYFTK